MMDERKIKELIISDIDMPITIEFITQRGVKAKLVTSGRTLLTKMGLPLPFYAVKDETAQVSIKFEQ